MSRRRRSRTSRQFSPPSSSIAGEAASTAPPEKVEPAVIVRQAETDDDVIAMHRFLMVVAPQAKATRCPINAVKSLNEIIRVTRDELALMLIRDGMLIGTMGIINPIWWYGDAGFLTDRWHFVLPEFDGTAASNTLMEEAKEIARLAGLEFLHNGKARERGGVLRLMPKIYS